MECGLCYQEFLPTDEVFNCQKMHVFHTSCYEERAIDDDEVQDNMKGMINKCPSCNAHMTFDSDKISINSGSV